MKKCFFLSIFVLCLALSGCIDIFHHITKNNNGIDKNTIKVTVSKTVFGMANGLSGSGDSMDYEKLFDESEMNTMDINEYTQFGASVKKINDMMDIGYLIDMNTAVRFR